MSTGDISFFANDNSIKIGGGLTWNYIFTIRRSSNNFFDIQILPSGVNQSLTLLEKTFAVDANGNFTLLITVRNNTANDTVFFSEGIEIAS